MAKIDFPGEGQEPSFPWRYLFKEVSPRTAARKAREGICKHWGCSKATKPNKRECGTCRSRLTRIRNPERYAYQQVKRSADLRDIPFLLSYEEFQQFDEQTGYTKSKGRENDSMTIDRIDSSKGYQLDNIRAITWADNCAKKLEGMTDPIDPIAKALGCVAKQKNWYKFRRQAVEILHQVEILQAQQDGGFEPPPEETADDCPF